MNDFTNTSEGEESLEIAAKDWDRIISSAKKTGYREGIENGSDEVFQEGFDKGYEEGFKIAFILGKFKSLLNTMPQNTKHPQHINEILDNTKRGICHICVTESQHTDENMQKPLSEIINEQRTHSEKHFQTLHQYYQSYAKELNIDKSNVVDTQNLITGLFKDN